MPCVSPRPSQAWAKSARDESGLWHSLVGHCTDVAVTGRELMATPVLRRRLSVAFETELTECHLDRLAIFIGLHDIGKALAGFQAKREQKLSIGQGHTAEGLAVLMARPESHQSVRFDLLQTWVDDAAAALFCTICHHGEPVSDARIGKHLSSVSAQLQPTIYGHDPLAEIARLTEALLEGFPDALGEAPMLTMTSAGQHFLAGITMAADWMGSDADHFVYASGEDEGRAEKARHIARKLISDTGITGWARTVAGKVLDGMTPRPAQAAMAELPMEQITTLEDQTGTGKTEAAMVFAQRLVEAGRVDGIYFAVPSRSAATELHGRIAGIARHVWPNVAGKIVRAVPGLIDTDERELHEPSHSWAIGSPKRVMAAPIAVGTIDQAMLSHLRVRHAWMRAAFLSRSLLIIDEAHASDPYMTEIIASLVDRHVSLGGYVLLLSATLGEAMRARLLGRAPRPIEEASAVPYPAAAAGASVEAVEASVRRHVATEILGHQECSQRVLEAVQAGSAVLWIRSTVADAIEDYQLFDQANVPVMLHHSRWADHDRRILDTRVIAAIGKEGARGGRVVVATQTCEQSLDIDADFLVTDACPADVLIQRLGRLHRHERRRPAGFEAPRCLLIEPGELSRFLEADGRPRGLTGQGWPWVYRALLSVQQTLEWVRNRDAIVAPDDCRELVERATHPDHLRHVSEELGGRWPLHWQVTYGQEAAQRARGQAGLIDWSRPYADALVDEQHLTRLAEGPVTIEVDLISPLDGSRIERMPVPAWWLRQVPPDTPTVCEGQRISVGNVDMIYGDVGLVRAG